MHAKGSFREQFLVIPDDKFRSEILCNLLNVCSKILQKPNLPVTSTEIIGNNILTTSESKSSNISDASSEILGRHFF